MFIWELYTFAQRRIRTCRIQLFQNPPVIIPFWSSYIGLVVLHWLTFILIFATFFLRSGEGGEGGRGGSSLIAGFPNLSLHMILGIIVLLLLIIRLVVRWRAKRPDWATTGNSFMDKIGELTHWALYLFTFGMVISGLILAMQGNRLVRTFGLAGTNSGQFNQSQQGQFQPGQFPPPGSGEGFRPGGFGRGNPLFILGSMHGLIWVVLFLLILLHVGAAFYHQLFIKDNLLGRMWFGRQTE